MRERDQGVWALWPWPWPGHGWEQRGSPGTAQDSHGLDLGPWGAGTGVADGGDPLSPTSPPPASLFAGPFKGQFLWRRSPPPPPAFAPLRGFPLLRRLTEDPAAGGDSCKRWRLTLTPPGPPTMSRRAKFRRWRFPTTSCTDAGFALHAARPRLMEHLAPSSNGAPVAAQQTQWDSPVRPLISARVCIRPFISQMRSICPR